MLKISVVYLIGNPKRVTLSASISENPVPLYEFRPLCPTATSAYYYVLRVHCALLTKVSYGLLAEIRGWGIAKMMNCLLAQ